MLPRTACVREGHVRVTATIRGAVLDIHLARIELATFSVWG